LLLNLRKESSLGAIWQHHGYTSVGVGNQPTIPAVCCCIINVFKLYFIAPVNGNKTHKKLQNSDKVANK